MCERNWVSRSNVSGEKKKKCYFRGPYYFSMNSFGGGGVSSDTITNAAKPIIVGNAPSHKPNGLCGGSGHITYVNRISDIKPAK